MKSQNLAIGIAMMFGCLAILLACWEHNRLQKSIPVLPQEPIPVFVPKEETTQTKFFFHTEIARAFRIHMEIEAIKRITQPQPEKP